MKCYVLAQSVCSSDAATVVAQCNQIHAADPSKGVPYTVRPCRLQCFTSGVTRHWKGCVRLLWQMDRKWYRRKR